ncbi:MAG: NAD-dependent epimerase/dehydratase family protein [Candidatus Promineifilaceae bacterium]|nr:NAD-dependent epimerase/dehydratase family protein [Candidatus Promineifilaceae bacterium]
MIANNLREKSVLVTGGAGFIGSHVVDGLIQAGCKVTVVDNLSTGKRDNINPRADFYEADIRDRSVLEIFRQVRPEAVSHHAAQSSVQVSLVRPELDAGTNILGTLNVLRCAVSSGTQHFIYIGTGGAVYGDPPVLPCTEEEPVNPLSPYAVSKYAGEHYARQMSAVAGVRHTVLRYANVYGPRQDPHGEAGVVAIFAGQMLSDVQPTINGDGLQERDFVYVGDCVRANIQALAIAVEGVFNIGTGIGTSINELYERLASVVGYGREPNYGPAKAGETKKIYLDTSKARERLRWEASVPLADGLKMTARALQSSKAG